MNTTVNAARKLGRLGCVAVPLVAAGLLCASPASAADPPSGDDAAQKDADQEAAAKKDGDAAKKDAGSSGLKEDPLKRYYFLGVRFRDIVVPQFMMEIFASGGATGNVWLVGPELSMRKDNTEIDISLSYADYGFGPAMFKGKNESDPAYEIVASDMKLIYLTFDLLLDVPLDKSGMFDFLIGGGLGIAGVAGNLYRDQAYPKNNGQPDATNPSKWVKCTGETDGFSDYCSNPKNDHYYKNGKDFSEPSWADGGSKPLIFPWISLPQLSLRVKPIKQLQARLDAGFSVSGFFFGLAAGYGF